MNRLLIFMIFVMWMSGLNAQKNNYKIGLLTDLQTETYDQLILELKTQIKAVVGEDANIEFPTESQLANNYSLVKAEENYQKLLNSDINLILAIGVFNHQVIQKQTSFPKPTILFGSINQDLWGFDLPKEKSGIPNFYYLMEEESYQNDLETFQELVQFNNIGIAVEEGVLRTLPLKETFEEITLNMGVKYKFIPFQKASDVSLQLKEIDAIYFVNGYFFQTEELEALAKDLIAKKIPSFTINGIDQVKNGFLATNQPDDNVDLIIRRLALTVEQFINGTPLSDIPGRLNYKPNLTLNYQTAKAMNLPIKMSTLTEVDLVGTLNKLPYDNTYSLNSLVNQALQNNLDIRVGKKQLELGNQAIRMAKSAYLPDVSIAANTVLTDPDFARFSFGQSPEFQTFGSLNLNQTIFSAAANAQIIIEKNKLLAEQEKLTTAQLNTIFQVVNAYFDILILQSNLQLQIQNLEVSRKNHQIAVRNFEAGLTGKTDILQFRNQITQNTQSLVEATTQLEQGLVLLNQLLNKPEGTKVDVERVTLDGELFSQFGYDELSRFLDDPKQRITFINFLKNEAQKNASELKALKFELNSLDKALRLNEAARFTPTVALQGQFNSFFNRSGAGSGSVDGFNISFPDQYYTVGLNVSIPVFNQNRAKLRQENIKIQKEQYFLQKENVERNIRTEVEYAVLSLVDQASNIELSKVSEATAKEVLDLTQNAYTSGSTNSIQLIDAQANFLNAQLNRATAIYNYLKSVIRIERAIGHFFVLKKDEYNNLFTARFLNYSSQIETRE